MKRLPWIFMWIAIIIGLSSLAFSAIITITVDDRISFESYTQTLNGSVDEVIVSIENTGSVTCPAQAKLYDGKQRFWSERVEMKPGGIEALRIYYLSPYNSSHQGKVYVYFCDEVREVANLTLHPSDARQGKVDISIRIHGNRIEAKGNATVIPFDNPSNFNIPSFRVEGKAVKEIYYPTMLSTNVTFLVTNGTHYQLVVVEPEKSSAWPWVAAGVGLVAMIFYALRGMLKHGPGKGKDGRHNSKKGKGRGKKAHKA